MTKTHIKLGLLGLAACILIVFFNSNSIEAEPSVPSTFEYGICVDTFTVVKGQVEDGQTLGAILYLNHIDHGKIDQIVRASKGIFDFRKAKAGQNYTVICSDDSIQKAQYFVYETSNTDFVVFDIRDTIQVYAGQKEVEVRLKESSGIIESSLWNALINNNMSPALVMELSAIYAWTIDFFRIQKGDYFKIIYEERYVEGEFVGIGRVYASAKKLLIKYLKA